MTHETIPTMGTQMYGDAIECPSFVEWPVFPAYRLVEEVDTFDPATRVFALDWSDGPLEIIELVLPEDADCDANG